MSTCNAQLVPNLFMHSNCIPGTYIEFNLSTLGILVATMEWQEMEMKETVWINYNQQYSPLQAILMILPDISWNNLSRHIYRSAF